MTDLQKQQLYIQQRKEVLLRQIQNDCNAFGADAVGLRPEHVHHLMVEVQSIANYQAVLQEEKVWEAEPSNLHISDAYRLMLKEANSRIEVDWLGAWSSGKTDLFSTFYADFQEGCNACGARGRFNCKSCGGRGKFECPESDCNRGSIECSCNGDGGICSSCKGNGRIWHDYSLPGGDDRRLNYCNTCYGSGRTGYCVLCNGQAGQACSRCSGRGFVLCSGCSGRGSIACSSCNGKQVHYGRFRFKINVKKIDEKQVVPAPWHNIFPNLMQSAPAVLIHEKTDSRKDAARLYRTLSVPVFYAKLFPDAEEADILMSGDEDHIHRSGPYLERMALHVLRAFENNDIETLKKSEFGRELLFRAHGGSGRTSIMDKYNFPQDYVEPILELCDQVQQMIKNRPKIYD